MSSVNAIKARLRRCTSVVVGIPRTTCRICSIGGHRPIGRGLGNSCLLFGEREVVGVRIGQSGPVARSARQPLKKRPKRIEGREKGPFTEAITRPLARPFRKLSLKSDGLLRMEAFEVTVVGVVLESGDRGRRGID